MPVHEFVFPNTVQGVYLDIWRESIKAAKTIEPRPKGAVGMTATTKSGLYYSKAKPGQKLTNHKGGLWSVGEFIDWVVHCQLEKGDMSPKLSVEWVDAIPASLTKNTVVSWPGLSVEITKLKWK